MLYGLQNPYQEKPLARPVANGNIRIMSPDSWGPLLGGLSLSVLMTYRAGRYDTWDPLTSYEINNIQWKDEYFFDMRVGFDEESMMLQLYQQQKMENLIKSS